MKLISKVFFVLIFVLSTSCTEEDSSPNISEMQLIQIGNKLAEWGNSNCKVISINDKNILWQGPNAGGCSEVYFEFRTPNRDTYFDFKALEKRLKEAGVEDWLIKREIVIRQSFLNHENEAKQSLKSAINNSTCQISELISNINSIDANSTKQFVMEQLECMGTIEISDGYSGPE